MAGTPTQPPGGSGVAGDRAEENGLAPQRPVPRRWSPSGEPPAVGLSPDPALMKPYVTPVPLKAPLNAAVMRTAPGESPA